MTLSRRQVLQAAELLRRKPQCNCHDFLVKTAAFTTYQGTMKPQFEPAEFVVVCDKCHNLVDNCTCNLNEPVLMTNTGIE